MSELSDYVVMPASHWVGILSATRQKTGKTDPITSGQLPMEILGIESTPAKVEPKYANFYDYDGTLLYSYTREEAMALTTLPDGPTHEGLTFQGWNHYNIAGREYSDGVDVGAYYMTDDTNTRIYINVTSKDTLEVPLRLYIATADAYTIDWGDGSSPFTINSTGNVIYKHTYPGTGKYVITLSGSGMGIGLGNGTGYPLCYGDDNDYVYSSYVYKVELGANVGGVNDYAFNGCTHLETVTISPTVYYIGSYAFGGCVSLRHINVPGSVAEIRDHAFTGCFGLKTVSLNMGCFEIGTAAFYNCHALTGITFPPAMFGQMNASGGVKEWASTQYPVYPGTSSSSMTTVTATGSLADSICTSCSALRRVSFPSPADLTSIIAIGNNAFYACSSLINVDIPDTVTQIGKHTFGACPSMPALYIPKSVTTLGTPFTSVGYSLRFIDFSEHESVPSYPYDGEWSSGFDLEIRVPAALYDSWIAASGWSKLTDYITAV